MISTVKDDGKQHSNARRGRNPKGAIVHVAIDSIQPSPENNSLYKPIDPGDPTIVALAASIKKHGVKEPIVITLDGFILSGHRRHAGSTLAGLATVPVRYEQIRRSDDINAFLELLREYNRQRVKSFDEKLREEVAATDPDAAFANLSERRWKQSQIVVSAFGIRARKNRKAISHAKRPFMDAVHRVLEENKKFWPLSDRYVHYQLLNAPPLRHASKPASVYRNDKHSYASLVDLLTRARIAGNIPMEAIADVTRPVTTWKVFDDPATFMRGELDGFLTHYWRNLLKSQPHHIELLAEKNTVAPIINDVAMQFCVPMTSGRGFCSLPPRYEMAQRYRKSGKDKLILLVVSDFDPDGEEIAHSFARSMRDDFGIESVHPIKVALTHEQVAEHKLPPSMEAKKTSSNYKRFASQFGKHAYEVEALPGTTLQQIVRTAIDSVIDVDLFNLEVEQEKIDAQNLEATRRVVVSTLPNVASVP